MESGLLWVTRQGEQSEDHAGTTVTVRKPLAGQVFVPPDVKEHDETGPQ